MHPHVIEGLVIMIDVNDFSKKQIIFLFPLYGDKLSFSNDNVVVKDKDGKIRHQSTCYQLFTIFIVGNITITSGLIQRAKKFGFSLVMMTQAMRVYSVIESGMEGNTLLRKYQYGYSGLEIAAHILQNKIMMQREALNTIRKKTPDIKEAIEKLDNHYASLNMIPEELQSLLGIEGSAARTYFRNIFNNVNWHGRKPRIKNDYMNSTLDIGYTILFNIIDGIARTFGFDTYYGVLHTCFYMRKSLICDFMEPMRPMIDLQVRKSINLGQCKSEDFEVLNGRHVLQWKHSPEYVSFLMEPILENKELMFLYIQNYYRAFMKQREINEYPIFDWRQKK